MLWNNWWQEIMNAKSFVSVSGSLLSDLSYSRSEDDLDSTLTRCGKVWKKHRPSLTAGDEATSAKRRRSAVEKTIEVFYYYTQGGVQE
jgi:hypothetical protein